jgi:3',5'-nucleoside bisphosphate phosphatase
MVEFKYNLHNHTTFSDGELTPTEVVALNKKQGYNVIAITDHDTIEGVNEAVKAGKKLGVVVIPGIELSTTKSHMLGLFINPEKSELTNFLNRKSIKKRELSTNVLNELAMLGYRLTPEMISKITKARDVNPFRIAFVLTKSGLVKDEKRAREIVQNLSCFKKYVSDSRNNLSEKEAIMLIKRANGAPILAHPFSEKHRFRYLTMPFRLFMLKWNGLKGIEVQHPDHSKFERGFLHAVASVLKLKKTGGSDFHDLKGVELSTWRKIAQSKSVQKSIKKLHKQRKR